MEIKKHEHPNPMVREAKDDGLYHDDVLADVLYNIGSDIDRAEREIRSKIAGLRRDLDRVERYLDEGLNLNEYGELGGATQFEREIVKRQQLSYHAKELLYVRKRQEATRVQTARKIIADGIEFLELHDDEQSAAAFRSVSDILADVFPADE